MKTRLTLGALTLAIAACSTQYNDSADDKAVATQARTPTAEESAPSAIGERREAAKRLMSQDAATAGQAQRLYAPSVSHPAAPDAYSHYEVQDRERYAQTEDNPVKRVSDDPLSTFSVDVDAASFSVVRRFLNEGRLPPVDAVRTEEIINALAYAPMRGLSEGKPLGVETRIMRTPWNAGTSLLQVRLNAWEPETEVLPDSNYVFLVDSSGSMRGEDRIGLLKRAFSVMLSKLKPNDTVALVSYASGSRTVLEPTQASERQKILSALDSLSTGGSTHASDGIQRAYRLAQQAFIKGGNNRVILATDGDVNVGLQGEALVEMIKQQRDRGIYLTVLGVGRGNYMDAQLEPLAGHGDGNYYYLDGFQEARRVLVSGLKGTAYTVAKDVKLQVEFNPAVVAEYRLIGYNNRQLAHADFNNDAKDAGDIGAGHNVTALYEITLRDSEYRFVDERRYGETVDPKGGASEVALVKLRYKAPEGGASTRLDHVVYSKALQRLAEVNEAVLAAGFAEKLRGSPFLSDYAWESLKRLSSVLDGTRDNHGDLKTMVETAAVLEASRG